MKLASSKYTPLLLANLICLSVAKYSFQQGENPFCTHFNYGRSQKVLEGEHATNLGSVGVVSPSVGPSAKPLETDKIYTYSFSFEVLEIQINMPMTLPSHRLN